MKQVKGWEMYLKIQELKKKGFNKSQIARHVGLDRRTVTWYYNATPNEVQARNEELKTRSKKLDKYNHIILDWLKKFPDSSSSQIHDWLREMDSNIEIAESSVANYVRRLRKEYNIPKVINCRQYESVEELPMGFQMQVDFGEKSLLDANEKWVKLRVIVFVLSHSRYKYMEWLDRPFKTSDVINAHENAFEYFGGIPKEVVYDQDHLILVSENNGDLIFTHEFANYLRKRVFKIYMCRKGDPESKGKVENAVGFVKKNFAHNRVFHNLDKLNEQALRWLDRTGNGKKHNTTKKIPAEVFQEEKKHLQPDTEKIIIDSTPSITATVKKDNSVPYLGNRYSVLLGTYKHNQDNSATLQINDDTITIIAPETGEILGHHPICLEKGKLIKNNNHSRDRSKSIQGYVDEIINLLGNTEAVKEFVDKLRVLKTRYLRDQLQLIKQTVTKVDNVTPHTISMAVDFCLTNQLYSATDICDALKHFSKLIEATRDSTGDVVKEQIKPLHQIDLSKLKAKPPIRSISTYIDILNGDN